MRIAGFAAGQRLLVDTFGETFRADGPEGRRARIRRVDAQLAERQGFVPTLLETTSKLAAVEGRHLVRTLAAGHADDGSLCVVTDDVSGPVSLEAILAEAALAGVTPPRQVAVYVCRAVARALVRVHRAQVVHGGVHPRSVLVDIDGEIWLDDVAVARAMAGLAAEDSSLLAGLHGYVAPEIALGDAPDVRTDVYAVGVMLHVLLGGAPPPDPVDAPESLRELCERAHATDAAARFADGAELLDALDQVAVRLGHDGAGAREVARFLGEVRGASNASLDAETEDILAGLDEGVSTASHRRLTEDDDFSTDVRTAPPHFRSHGSSADDPTPLPPAGPVDDVTGPQAALGDGGRDLPLAPPVHTPPPELLGPAPDPAPRPMPAQVAPEPFDATSVLPQAAPRGLGALWLVVVALSLGVVFLVVWFKTDIFHPERRAAKLAELEAERLAHEEKVKAARTALGDVVVESEPLEAAVWLLLCRTPCQTMPLPVAGQHELRIEHEGFEVHDTVVAPASWIGTGDDMKAQVRASLTPARPGYLAPPSPPPPPEMTAAPRPGAGPIHVESQPPGAQVWLLVGFTPDVRVTNLSTEKEHEFKLTREGYAPAYTVVRVSDWELPGGGKKREVRVMSELTKRPGRR